MNNEMFKSTEGKVNANERWNNAAAAKKRVKVFKVILKADPDQYEIREAV